MKIEDINDELKCNIMEFINVAINHNNLATVFHLETYYTSRLFNFSKKLNEILENENSQIYHASYSDFNDYVIKDYYSKLLDENNTSKKLVNEIFESENSQANVKVNEILVSEDLNNYIIKDLELLDIKTDEN
ncbi:unnamed protein product [Rhizophagus irregularis]|nr:unnamed protein product [Rhizophagus irregularis]